MTRTLAILLAAATLGGCSTLPGDGPAARNIDVAAPGAGVAGGYAVVDLDYLTAQRIKTAAAMTLSSLAGAASEAPVDIITVGDTLAVSIFEPGGALFGARSVSGAAQSGGTSLPPVVVDRSGVASIPFAGPVRVAGLTGPQAAEAIRRALIGKVGAPQVLVSIAASPSNAVTVLGEVRSPGRAALVANADRILDVIAAAGGTARAVEDVEVTIQRDGRTFTAPLSSVTTAFDENIRLARGDQVNLVYRPRRYATFGALGRVSQIDMGTGPLSLTSALSRAGGLDTNSADARAVLIFRFERPEVARALGLQQAGTDQGVPVIYRVDLTDPAGFFTANNFPVQADDILYVPRAGAAEARKFFDFIQSITRVIYDVSVTSALTVN
ncbi:polysaccharide biosynthesis/export family protein [uncultured Brevundimonas sp.]|uniref:polysaccharide biosynthesis/export family protein n=1 Tax=uncultured Brevundimonas sp. TaxID=213418 RepID=UPI0030ECA98D|tara:strand:- start:23866 stop:25014 length:1149 start_codon:yes stop_codon:yes gene_type:complete